MEDKNRSCLGIWVCFGIIYGLIYKKIVIGLAIGLVIGLARSRRQRKINKKK